MNCSVCGKTMVEEDFGGVKVDVCKSGCKGMWFDWFELSKLDEKNEGVGNALQAALKCPRSNDLSRPPLKCPKCQVPMHPHKYSSQKEVNVDECYACGGFFLDSGEFVEIRDRFMSEQERDEYCQKLIKDIPQLAQAEKDLEKEKARIEALRHYTRFLRLSYYVTKK